MPRLAWTAIAGSSRPVLIGPNGIHDTLLWKSAVPWSAVIRMSARPRSKPTEARIELSPEDFAAVELTLYAKQKYMFTRVLRGPTLPVSAANLKTNFPDLWRDITACAKAHDPAIQIEGKP